MALERLEQSESIEHVRNDLVFHLGIAAAAHNPVIEMMLEAIAPQTVALMLRSVGDRRSWSAASPTTASPSRRSSEGMDDAARAAILAHLSVASELYGDDFDRSVDDLAGMALRRLGTLTSLDDIVAAALRVRTEDATTRGGVRPSLAPTPPTPS